MKGLIRIFSKDIYYSLSISFLLILGIFVLRAIAPRLFPSYFLYILLAIGVFFVFSKIEFNILKLFSSHLYILSVILLVITLIIGSVTRGTVRWIPIGPITLQTAEIARPFLMLFFADKLGDREISTKMLIRSLVLVAIPLFLILIQPSLGVTMLTGIGFFGILLAKDFDKKQIIYILLIIMLALPLFWLTLRPYQKDRILGFTGQGKDPLGSGYNSIQAMISVGSGKIYGRTLGKGVQTQLAFLPEKQTDFIFATIAEELGLIGSLLLIFFTFSLLWRLTVFLEKSVSPIARSFVAGVFLTLVAQILVHAGMNMGMLPVTGIPYPLVSAGGSSLLATMAELGMVLSAFKKTDRPY